MICDSTITMHHAVKVKVSLHAMQELRRRGIQLLVILDRDTRWGEWSESSPGRDLPLEKDSRYPLDRRQGGPHSWSGHRGWRKN
jgi:hypothetical protein